MASNETERHGGYEDCGGSRLLADYGDANSLARKSAGNESRRRLKQQKHIAIDYCNLHRLNITLIAFS